MNPFSHARGLPPYFPTVPISSSPFVRSPPQPASRSQLQFNAVSVPTLYQTDYHKIYAKRVTPGTKPTSTSASTADNPSTADLLHPELPESGSTSTMPCFRLAKSPYCHLSRIQQANAVSAPWRTNSTPSSGRILTTYGAGKVLRMSTYLIGCVG